MVANSKLKAELIKKMHISQPTLYARANKIIEALDMDVDEAIYLLALQHKFKLKRYGLDVSTINHVRDLQLKYKSLPSQSSAAGAPAARPQRKDTLIKVLQIKGGLKLDDPLIPDNIKQAAHDMAAVYPLFYYLENSIRTFICKAMEKYYGTNWWTTVKPSLQQKVRDNQANDKKNSWHQKRGAREVDYLDFKELKGVITKARTRLVADQIIPAEDWIDDLIDEVYPSRCVLAHMNPLTALNINAVKVKVQFWQAQVKGVHKLL
jgi:hypothetical protein